MRRGVAFDLQPDGELALGLEGGHSARRIVHAGGAETGRALTSRLAAARRRARADRGPRGRLGPGALVRRRSLPRRPHRSRPDRRRRRPSSRPAAARRSGSGRRTRAERSAPAPILAHAAGADLADLELCQFHPTALALPGERLDGWLITEAVRGEGALLLGADGRRFTDELAPRDQVTAAILDRMAADGTGAVDLDLRPVPMERFPTITADAASRSASTPPPSRSRSRPPPTT